ncbi:transcriptional regulator MarR family protein [Halorhabdus tiamatea SARL4B]|uniref:Transcriptional regulator MarR family protein n=1 Tax=Halorhabdus tiamatea SARL4B TaxID=1033806 RepID=F7PM61_9EURY|nr:MarR family transcriptional regulator [Halorhabdus tiamatea]ERJ05319.1 transcriptional regulator MarR family protein [Halorhabdus tiamatea SARL4B]CCQ33161.1 transcriptional regulator, MarR family [Halorhabdus tiamatea SARL4B]
MKRKRTDVAAAILVGAVLLLGGGLTWKAIEQRRTVDETMGSMMDASVGTMHGPDPLWFAVGTLVVAAVLGGIYLLVRPEFEGEEARARSGQVETRPGQAETRPDQVDATPATGTTGPDAEQTDQESTTDDSAAESTETDAIDGHAVAPEANPTERVLDLLPEDERRVLEPVLESPGITQIELRDRSAFSKSKVSQTVTDLEERGLLYRERQGRTYRIYPSAELGANRGS